MARFLVYTSPARGHLYPLVPTLEELGRRGHVVAVRTLASEVELIRDLGFSARAINPAIERRQMDDWRASKPLAAQHRALRTWLDRAPHEVPDLGRAIDEERPDALFVDINCWGAAAVAEAWGGPWAYFTPYLLFIPSCDVPPFGPGLPPLKGLAGKLRDGLVRRIGDRSADRLLPGLNALRDDLGVPPIRHFTHLPLAAPLVVYYTAEPFDYPRSDWPESVRMVGPGIWDPPARRPAWLDDDESEEPLVLVTLSTEFQDDAKLVEVALEALKDEDVRVAATTAVVDPSRFVAPANARVERFLPHEHLLERAACVVCHGGMGITQKALAKGVPVCAVPFGRDQLEVARRVEVAGAGSRLPASRLRPDRLRSAVREAMGKKDGAERIAAAFAGAGGSRVAAEALEKLLDGPSDELRRGERARKSAR